METGAGFMYYRKMCGSYSSPGSWFQFKKGLSARISPLNIDELFKHYNFIALIKHIRGIECENAAIAFDNLELYIRLLYQFPWKCEYRTLKTYCGFYSTMIDKLMPCNRKIFEMLGYVPNNESVLEGNPILELTILPAPQTLLTVGFDCLVASAHCKLRQNIFNSNMQFRTIDYKIPDNDKQFTEYNKLDRRVGIRNSSSS